MIPRLSTIKHRIRAWVVPKFLSYDGKALLAVLRELGVRNGDVLMVHSAFRAYNGFRGSPKSLLEILKQAVGERGLLMLPSLTYTDSSESFLRRAEIMDVRRSPSRMGLLTEVFRRGKDTYRSLSPTHPLLAWGRAAKIFLQDHDKTIYPFGTGSPFEKLLALRGKILCFDTDFSAVTFTHFVEDHFKERCRIQLYNADPMIGKVIDYDGQGHAVPVMVLSDEARRTRDERALIGQLERQRALKSRRIGNTKIVLIACEDIMSAAETLYESGKGLFRYAGSPAR